jgi:hypothetical protein
MKEPGITGLGYSWLLSKVRLPFPIRRGSIQFGV